MELKKSETLLVSEEVYEITIDTYDPSHEVMIYIIDTVDDVDMCMFIAPEEARRLGAVLTAMADVIQEHASGLESEVKR